MRETVRKLRESLIPLYGKGESDAIIRLIFHYLKNWNLTDILIHQEEKLSPYIKEKVDEILQRLRNYEPIQYITGEARFHGMDLKINPGVLIPRQETEELVDIIIDENKNRDDLSILDLCTGTGCIALSLARCLPFSNVTAIDISKEAIATAKINANALKTKITLIEDDIFKWTPSEKYDIIVSNPPYVMDKEALTMERNVLDYEPHEAIFVRDDTPLQFYQRIIEISKKNLKDYGKLYLEINPLTKDELKNYLIKHNFIDITVLKDSYGKDRFLKATKEN